MRKIVKNTMQNTTLNNTIIYQHCKITIMKTSIFCRQLRKHLEAKKNNIDVLNGMFDIVVFYKHLQNTHDDLRVKCQLIDNTMKFAPNDIKFFDGRAKQKYKFIQGAILDICKFNRITIVQP